MNQRGPLLLLVAATAVKIEPMIMKLASTSARPAQLLRCQLPSSFTFGLLPDPSPESFAVVSPKGVTAIHRRQIDRSLVDQDSPGLLQRDDCVHAVPRWRPALD